jgi:alpha-beta hydrolase superfamily lysophospholipase
LLLLVLLGALLRLSIRLRRVPAFVSTPNSADNYQKAIKNLERLNKPNPSFRSAPRDAAVCSLKGHNTERVFVLLHGLTNCPEQFMPLARMLHASGANVIVPRARHAGCADRMKAVQGWQSGQDLLDQAALGFNTASGLGDRISLVGFSGSAAAAAWMAQHREGLECVLLVSPFFGSHGQPVALSDGLAAVPARAPNVYLWWNDKLKCWPTTRSASDQCGQKNNQKVTSLNLHCSSRSKVPNTHPSCYSDAPTDGAID